MFDNPPYETYSTLELNIVSSPRNRGLPIYVNKVVEIFLIFRFNVSESGR